VTVTLTVPAQAGRPGLLLRPWAAHDAEALAAAHADAGMKRWLATSVDGRQAAAEWITAQSENWAEGLRFSFAVLEQADTEPVGHVVVKRAAARSRITIGSALV